jgi:uncharacterized membrane protein YgdD (TMEM256/DUF423 family)
VNESRGEPAAARRALASGAALMAVGTAVGALGAHALRGVLSPERFAVLQTAVLYQFINALGLLALGLLLARNANRVLRVAADMVLGGVLLFSGSLYALLCGAPRLLGLLTPLGGMLLISGWCLAAVALLRARQPFAP